MLDEPTDEELLEATQEHDQPIQPPAALIMVQPAESPAPSSPPLPPAGAATLPPALQERQEEELPGPAFLPPPPPAGSAEVSLSVKQSVSPIRP